MKTPRRDLEGPDLPAGPGPLLPLFLEGCAAYLHLPPEAAPARARGAVLCSALGYDERCLRRPMRLLADELARRGVPTVRFDLPGQGDSRDLEPGENALEAWLGAHSAAETFLREKLGVQNLVFGGFRLGAALAAVRAGACDRLLLLAPVVSGRSWLARVRFAAAQGGARQRPGGPDGGLDADGVVLSPEDCARLSKVDLAAPGPPLPETFLASKGRPPAALLTALEARCARVECAPFPGYDGLLIGASDNEIAPEVIESACAFAIEDAPAERSLERLPPRDLVLDLSGPGWRETLEEPEEGLFAAVTRPDPPASAGGAGGVGVIFLNAGGDPKAGVGRFAAHAARRLAAEGRLALRLDFRGVGDSREPEGVARTHPYLTHRGGEIAAAARTLAGAGAREIYLVGISAGGFQALWGLIGNPDLRGAFCISTLKFVWRPGDGVVIGSRRWGRPASAYARDLLRPATWRRLAGGDVRVGAIARSLLARLASLGHDERRTPESRALQKAVKDLSAKGRRIGLFMGTEDASLEEVEAHFGKDGRRFTALPGMSLEVRQGLDHGLVYARSRVEALEALEAFLEGA